MYLNLKMFRKGKLYDMSKTILFFTLESGIILEWQKNTSSDMDGDSQIYKFQWILCKQTSFIVQCITKYPIFQYILVP